MSQVDTLYPLTVSGIGPWSNQVESVTILEIPVRNSWNTMRLLRQSLTVPQIMKLTVLKLLILLGNARNGILEDTFCVGSGGYFGECSSIQSCRENSFSFSRSCGFQSVCCERRSRDKTNFAKPNVSKQFKPNLSKVTSCGLSSLHLSNRKTAKINNNVAKPGHFPWMVSFVYQVIISQIIFCD